MDALGGEQSAHPLEELLPLVEPLVEEQARSAVEERDLVLPALVLELGEVEGDDDLLQLVGGVVRSDQRRRDRPGRGARDVPRLEPALLEHRVRPREADALDAPALEDEVDVVLLALSSHHYPSSRRWPQSQRLVGVSSWTLPSLLGVCQAYEPDAPSGP